MGKVGAKNRIRRNRILRTLLDEGQISLSDIARNTGLTLPMVSKVIAGLKGESLILTEEGARVDHAGRPPIMAQLNGDAGFVVGVDLGHRNTNLVVLNLEQKLLLEKHIPSYPLGNDPKIVDWLVSEIDLAVGEAVMKRKNLFGVGISLPGMVRSRDGQSMTYLNFGGRPLQGILQKKFGFRVHVEHDAKAMALGERWFGDAKDAGVVLVLNIGWGLGLGILLDGKIYLGRDGYAGEFGHINVIKEGLLCSCGKRGCLETVASGMAIGREARERLKRGGLSILSEMCKGNIETVDAEHVAAAAVAGDSFSIEILEEAGKYLGEGVAKLINLFNPEKIILGGRVSQAGDFILNPVRAAALKQSLVQLNQNVEFMISSLGAKAGALGVAMHAARDIFEIDHLHPQKFV